MIPVTTVEWCWNHGWNYTVGIQGNPSWFTQTEYIIWLHTVELLRSKMIKYDSEIPTRAGGDDRMSRSGKIDLPD